MNEIEFKNSANRVILLAENLLSNSNISTFDRTEYFCVNVKFNPKINYDLRERFTENELSNLFESFLETERENLIDWVKNFKNMETFKDFHVEIYENNDYGFFGRSGGNFCFFKTKYFESEIEELKDFLEMDFTELNNEYEVESITVRLEFLIKCIEYFYRKIGAMHKNLDRSFIEFLQCNIR